MQFARLVLTAIFAPTILVAAAACALFALLAQLGRYSDGWDLLAHAAPLYLAGGLFTLAAALVFHDRYRTAALALGLVAVAGAAVLMAPEYLRSTGPKAAPGATPALKVVQFNMWEARGGVPKVVAWLADQNPDVVVVEESNRHIRAALVQAGWRAVVGRSAVMLFTRVEPAGTIVPIDNETGPTQLNGVVLNTAAGPTTILGVHYPWPNRAGLREESDNLMRIVRGYPSATTVLVGDFNSTPWSFTLQREDREFGLIRRERALFSWPIWPHLPVALLPIDHVYAGAGWATVKVERGPNLGSDHYPVVLTLAPRAPS